MPLLIRWGTPTRALSPIAVAGLILCSHAANADLLSTAPNPLIEQHQSVIEQELSQQRAFVAAALEQSQAVLSNLMEQNHSVAGTNFGFDPASQNPAAERLSDFSAQQAEIIADYALGMRLRNERIAGDFSDHVNARALLFFQTGSLFGLTDLELEDPQTDPPIAPPALTVPFPGLTAPIGGFFAMTDSNP